MSGSEALMYMYLAGTAAQMAGQEQQAEDKRNILNRSLAESDATQGKAIETVKTEASQLAPGQRQQAMTAAQDAAYQRTMADVAGAGGSQIDTAAGAGAVSDDFTRAKSEVAASEGARTSKLAQQLAAVRAPGDVTTSEAMRRSAIAEQLGSLWSSQNQRSKASGLDADSVEMPGWGQAGGLLAMVSGAAMGAGAGGGATGGEAVSGMDLAADSTVGQGNNVWGAGSTWSPHQSAGGTATASNSTRGNPYWFLRTNQNMQR